MACSRIFHATDDYYLGLRVGMVAEPRDALTAHEMLMLANAPKLDGLFPSRGDQRIDAMTELARRLKKYGARALSGDAAIFEEARALRRSHTEKYMRPAAD